METTMDTKNQIVAWARQIDQVLDVRSNAQASIYFAKHNVRFQSMTFGAFRDKKATCLSMFQK